MTQNTSHAVMQQRHEAHDSLDDFPTPPWAVRGLIEHVLKPLGRDLKTMTAWEPACNRGYMAKPLAEAFGKVFATDVHDYGWFGQAAVHDFLQPYAPTAIEAEGVDWIITNPPFRLAADFARRMLELRTRGGFAILVRIAFLEGVQRYNDLFSLMPPAIIAQYVERVPMVKGRHDPDASTATAYCWLVWPRGAGDNQTRFTWIPPCRRQLQKPTDA